MQRGTGGTVFEPVQPERRDREVTLGPFTLTLIGCGLFALCGFCFVFGYAVGRRNPESSAAISVPPPATPALAPSASAQSKPPAGQGESQPEALPASTASTDSAADSETGASATPPSGATAQPAASPAGTALEPSVHTVVATQPVAQPSSGAAVQPALAQSGGIMVQIAAVSHPEDADVLVGALRKRGYTVTARRDPSDGLLHVQIGPFANRSDAYAMRQKLLNDGYNAIVQP